MDEKKGCFNCRHHSKEPRRKALEVGDGDLELVTFDDEPQVIYACREPSVGHREMGPAEVDPGASCELWEEAQKKGLSPELERLLSRRS